MKLGLRDFLEELQDHIANESDLDLTVSENFTIGNLLDLQDIDTYLSSEIELTMFEEGGGLRRSGRRHHQERTVRFLYKGDYGQQAVNRCLALIEWLSNNSLSFQTSNFREWMARTDKLPSVIAAAQTGTHLADCVVTFLVFKRG